MARFSGITSLILVAMMYLPLALKSQWESGDKLVQANDPAQITSAVMITNISVENKTVQCGLFVKPPLVIQPVAPFQASSDWLKTMAIFLINRTDKVIASGEITLNFLETGDCRTLPCATAKIHIGQLPAVDAYVGRTGAILKPDHPEMPSLDWRPSQTIAVHIGDYTEDVEHGIESFMSVNSVRRVAVHIGPFFFQDGMRWGGGGGFALPDPEHRGRFKYLPDDYFPGRRGQNWPPGYNQ